jgi:hypothetical protein
MGLRPRQEQVLADPRLRMLSATPPKDLTRLYPQGLAEFRWLVSLLVSLMLLVVVLTRCWECVCSCITRGLPFCHLTSKRQKEHADVHAVSACVGLTINRVLVVVRLCVIHVLFVDLTACVLRLHLNQNGSMIETLTTAHTQMVVGVLPTGHQLVVGVLLSGATCL